MSRWASLLGLCGWWAPPGSEGRGDIACWAATRCSTLACTGILLPAFATLLDQRPGQELPRPRQAGRQPVTAGPQFRRGQPAKIVLVFIHHTRKSQAESSVVNELTRRVAC